jgi:hypothetical protein
LVGTAEGKRPQGRPRYKWEDSIGINLREIEWGGVDWIDLAQDKNNWKALMYTVMNLRVP